MLNKLFFGGVAADNADAPHAVSTLPRDPAALAQLLGAEQTPQAQAGIVASLGKLLAETADVELAQTLLGAPECTDAVRAAVALQTEDEERRRLALAGIGAEEVLVDVALAAPHAPARLAAAERVHAPDSLRRLFEGAKDKDRGVARIARQRLDAIKLADERDAAADAILAQAEALAAQPGPIVMTLVELDKRWKALDLGADAERHARWEAVGQLLQQRFDRERDEHRAHTQFEQRLDAWLATLTPVPAASALPALRAELEALKSLANEGHETAALQKLAQAEQQIVRWEQAAPALASAEALVIEAEALAAGTPIDDAQLPTRWQALDLAVRTPALTRRFEAALLVIEQRRLAIVRATREQEGAARQQLHVLLHAAEQALAAGQLQEARAAIDEARALKPAAGTLPKPTVQRTSRVVQQLVELERWQKFGQQTARVQLCERAEALLAQAEAPKQTPAALAREVQSLRAEWKKLDEQYAGVPKPLWERFDSACEKAYAPAARHFAEQAAQHKQARTQREDFIALAAAHAPTLATGPRDWRAIDRWLHETDATWHGATLGSVDPGAWKKLDARMKEALAPLRAELAAARHQARTERQALIAEAEALAAKAMERDAPARVKDLQARWQAHAKATTIAPRDERVLWEKFRAACNAVFDARKSARTEADERRDAQRRAFEIVCEALEQLAGTSDAGAVSDASDGDEAQIRRRLRELNEAWSKALAEHGKALPPLETRLRAARARIDDLLRGRSRAQEAAVFRALLDRERLCEELDALVVDGGTIDAETLRLRWDALPPIAPAWEARLAARRDQALHAMSDEDAHYDYLDRRDEHAARRRDALLELELMFHLDSPPDLQPQRLAVQVKQLRERLKRGAAGAGGAEQILLDWCGHAGVADERDRQRCERIVATLERRR